jgi:predicted glutamine amidotransferase
VAHRDAEGAIRITKAPERGDVSDRLRAWLDACVTDMAVVHLRMASPDLPVALGNTHPFGDARAAFVHNGDFRPRDCLDSAIDRQLLDTAEGRTDSERYYLAVRTRMDAGVPPAKAITQVADEVRLLAADCMALNCLLLTPTSLYAYHDHDPGSEVVARRGEAYFDLCRRDDGRGTLVASQGWAQPEPQWQSVPGRTVLELPAGGR